MHLQIAVVDDLRADRERLIEGVKRYFEARPEHSLGYAAYENAEALLSDRPGAQLVFLDICMEGMNGIDLAKRLRAFDEKLLIVFLSTSRDFAFEAFPIHPFDYLVKPYTDQALHRVLGEAMHLLASSEATVEIRVPRAVHRIPIRHILSAEAQGHAVELRLVNGERLRSNMTFAELEELLGNEPRFLLCNRGVLVNMDYALSLEDDRLRMQDGTVFPLRTRGRGELAARFTQYQFSRLKGGRS